MRVLASLCLLSILGCGDSPTLEGPGVGESNAAPAEPSPECDPATQRSFCEGNELVRCTDEGFFEWEPCAGRNLCAQGSDGAACLWRLGEVCESDLVLCDEPGGILRCEGRWTFEGCPVGGACIANGQNSFCAGPEDERCEYGEYAPVCPGIGVTQCAFGVVEERPCAAGEVCRDGLEGGVCVSANAEPCDPNAMLSRCREEGVAEYCDATTGWTLQLPCSEDDRCFEGDQGAACADASSTPCDISEFEAGCTGGVARYCSGQGFVVETPCGADESCAADVSCVLGRPSPIALCYPADAEPCPEPTDLFCDDGTMAICIDGAIAIELPFWECTDGSVPTCDAD